jgi:hypothetical protein
MKRVLVLGRGGAGKLTAEVMELAAAAPAVICLP